MSNAIFPVLPGLTWDIGKRPEYNTMVHRAVSGKEARAALMAYPLWTFTLSYEMLRDGVAGVEFDKLAGFFGARQGSFDSFLFDDTTDNSVTDQQFGTGDGTTTQFQLVRTFGNTFTFLEPVQNVNVLTNIKDNGSVVSGANYSVSNGLVTFNTPPVTGHTLTWTGTYYFRVRFVEDVADFNLFMYNFWELKKIQLVGSPLNKV